MHDGVTGRFRTAQTARILAPISPEQDECRTLFGAGRRGGRWFITVRDDKGLGRRYTLICTGTRTGGGRARGLWTPLVLLALFAALVLAGCGGAGSGGGSPSASGEDGPKPEKAAAGSGGRASKEKLGHPALGSADAPVVLTEYSDYQ